MSVKNYRKKHILSRFIAVMCLAFTMTLSFPFTAHADNIAKKTVRVGYYENEVFQEGAEEGAVKTGYAYEYYCKLSEYTGWKYEYVYGGFGDLYQMLLDMSRIESGNVTIEESGIIIPD